MRRRFSWLIALVTIGFSIRAAEVPLEYQVKAVCVLNAARFVSWPASVFANPEAPFVIGILGDNPFGSILQEAVKGETVQKRHIVVRRVTLQEAATVQVLFISQSERHQLAEILRTLGNVSLLTVSEIDRFTQDGGMLRLALVEDKIRFEINAPATRRAGLKVDPQFLLLAGGAK